MGGRGIFKPPSVWGPPASAAAPAGVNPAQCHIGRSSTLALQHTPRYSATSPKVKLVQQARAAQCTRQLLHKHWRAKESICVLFWASSPPRQTYDASTSSTMHYTLVMLDYPFSMFIYYTYTLIILLLCSRPRVPPARPTMFPSCIILSLYLITRFHSLIYPISYT